MSGQDDVFAKAAWRLIPFMMLLYVVNYIDRVNVGFAALTMNKDLSFSPAVYGFGAGAFFLGYSLFQIPANLILERVSDIVSIFILPPSFPVLSSRLKKLARPRSNNGTLSTSGEIASSRRLRSFWCLRGIRQSR